MPRKHIPTSKEDSNHKAAPNRKDLTGEVFGRLTVVKYDRTENWRPVWECICQCGKTVFVVSGSLSSGDSKSCGCLQLELAAKKATKHGFGSNKNGRITPEYSCWNNIKARCYNKNNEKYPIYGGRGIKVCDRWLNSFDSFFSDMGFRPSPKHSIDRINVDGDYEPSNCRWATAKEQQNNRTNNRIICFNGESLNLYQWFKRYDIPSTSYRRYKNKGIPDVDILQLYKK